MQSESTFEQETHFQRCNNVHTNGSPVVRMTPPGPNFSPIRYSTESPSPKAFPDIPKTSDSIRQNAPSVPPIHHMNVSSRIDNPLMAIAVSSWSSVAATNGHMVGRNEEAVNVQTKLDTAGFLSRPIQIIAAFWGPSNRALGNRCGLWRHNRASSSNKLKWWGEWRGMRSAGQRKRSSLRPGRSHS